MATGGVPGNIGMGQVPDPSGLSRTAEEATKDEHLTLLKLLPQRQVLLLGGCGGLLTILLLISPFALAFLGGVIFLLFSEGVLGLNQLDESAWEFISGLIGSGIALLRSYGIFLSGIWLVGGVLGAGMAFLRQTAIDRRGYHRKREQVSRWVVLPYLVFAGLISWLAILDGGLNVIHSLGLGLMLAWVPTFIFTMGWMVSMGWVLSWVLSRNPHSMDMLLTYQIRLILDKGRIDPSVRAVVEDGEVHLYGTVQSRDERRDAENLARGVRGAGELVSHIEVKVGVDQRIQLSPYSQTIFR